MVLILVVVSVVASKAALSKTESVRIVRPTRAAVRKTHSTDTAPHSLCKNRFILSTDFIILLFFGFLQRF